MREVGLEQGNSRRANNAPGPVFGHSPSQPAFSHALEIPRDLVPQLRKQARPRQTLASHLPVFIAVAAGALSFLVLTSGGRDVRVPAPLSPHIQHALVLAGFGIGQISIAGHKFTDDHDVYDAIDLANVKSFADLDAAAVRARIERLPWVETADLARVYPGKLEVKIKERTPFALWRRGDRDFLIDRTGRVLAPVKREAKLALPRVEGEGAESEAPGLVALLARFPEFSNRLESAEWVSGRRWTLHLKDGVVVHLPADSETLALQELAGSPDLKALATGSLKIIDMRAPSRVTVRSAPRQVRLPGGPS